MDFISLLFNLILIIGLGFIAFAVGFIIYRGVTFRIGKKRLGPKLVTIGGPWNRFLAGAMINTLVGAIFLIRFVGNGFNLVDGVMSPVILVVALFFYYIGLQKNAVYQRGISSPNGPRTWEQIETFLWHKSLADTILFRVQAKTFLKLKRQYESWKVPPQYQKQLTEMLKKNGVEEARDVKKFLNDKGKS